MVRLRKLALAVAAATALSSGTAHALGLGEITLKSGLNQPLNAEIELVEVKDLNQSEVIPSLGSPEDFSKAGVDRAYFLTGLKFTPVVNANGKSVIRVTSSQPVREPYLNFLMEVLWPNGRLLREYTVLLDPPLYAPTPTITATAPVAAAPAVVRPAPQPIARAPQAPVSAAPVARPAPVQAAAPAAATAPVASAGKLDGQYTSSKNDTLWEIALRARPAGASVHQTMLAIYDLNTSAFIDGNINRLKSGQVLRLPSAEQAKSRTSDEAIAVVAEHNKAWKEGRSVAASSARQLDATRRDTAGAAPATSDKKDRLSLVSGQEGKAQGSDKAAAAGNAALQNKLAVTQETLDSSRRENTELKDRLKDLDSQLEKLQRLIKLKDAQLAKMQAELAEQGKAAPVEATPEVTKPAEPTPAASAPSEPAAADPAAKPAETVDYNYTEEPAPDKPVEQAATPPAPAAPVEPAPAPVVEAPKPAPQPAKPVQQPAAPQPVAPQETSFIDDLLADPMMLGVVGGSGVLVLLLGLMAISRRNAMKEANLQEQELAAGDDSLDLGGDLDLGQDDDFASDEAMPQAADGKGDVLHEVDMLMAYGRFSQAAEQLNNAIDQEPERADLRLKLMEVYGEMGDADGFARQENELADIGGSQAQVDQLKAKYAALAGGLAASAAALADDNFSLDDMSLDDIAEPAAEVAESAEDSFDLSLDDLETQLESDLADAGDSLDELSLDEDFSLDALDSPAPAAEAEAADDDFDLSLDDLSADLASSETAEADDLDAAFDLSLDDEVADAPAAAPAAEAALEDDFSFSLDDEPATAEASDELSLDGDFDLSLDETPATAEAADDELADFALSLEDEAPEQTETAAAELSLDDLELPGETSAELDDELSADLGADFDLSLDDEAPALNLDEAGDDFAAQLDEVSKDLDDLSGDLDSLADDFTAGVAEEPVAALDAAPEAPEETTLVDEVASAAATADDDDFDFLAGTDETATKLDLARAYIDMGDSEGARDILSEVMNEGNDGQQQEAKELMEKLG